MPEIGVMASNQRDARKYLDAIKKRGISPRLVKPLHSSRVDDTIYALDGLLLTGGPDIDPCFYGAARDLNAGLELSQRRDIWELAMLKAALERDMPVLAICRGMQLLNVVFGGKLVQDLPGHRVENQRGSWELTYHHVYISPGSKLAAIIGSGGFARVNSLHHQGAGEPQKASGLMAVAYSIEDGLIEALESPKHDWVIGVQWHNEIEEKMPKNFGNLFQAFIERAETYAHRKEAGLYQMDLTRV